MVQTHAQEVSEAVEFPVTIQSDTYPVTITWNVNKGTASYVLTDGVGGRLLTAKSMNGEGSMKITNSSVTKFSVKLTGDGQLPKEYALAQNYPNPFNPSTTIGFAIPQGSFTTLKVYNILGQEVATLVNEEMKPGTYEVNWSASSNSSGVYLFRLQAGKFTETRRMILLK
jgi:hypothetical protein